MSWSVNFVGKPAKIIEALNDFSTKSTGQSKEEFDAALPHLTGLLSQNYNNAEGKDAFVKLNASGSGYVDGGKDMHRSCSIVIEQIYNPLI